MNYHIDTNLIIEKMKEKSECPLCEIKKIVEEQLLQEFLNDAVMDDDTRKQVNANGFCPTHFDMLFARQNKLSLALQIQTRSASIQADMDFLSSYKGAKKLSEKLKKARTTCVICDLVNESMIKYYKTIAQLFTHEPSFKFLLNDSKGFCLDHYAQLLSYSDYAGLQTKQYLQLLSNVENDNFERLKTELNMFCLKHDYRYRTVPIGEAETSLSRMRTKLYGKKPE